MRLSFGLSLEQTQKLIMTPELRQAITILQLSAIELTEYIEQELLENPVLEKKEETEKGEHEEIVPEEKSVLESKVDIDWQEYFQDRIDLDSTQRERREQPEKFGYENFLSQSPSLQDHLLTQLSFTKLTKAERELGEYIIGNMNEHGYLTCSLEEIWTGFEVSAELAEKSTKGYPRLRPSRCRCQDPSGVLITPS